MKRKHCLILAALISFFTIKAQEEAPGVFPQDFFGIYTGTLQVESESGSQEYAMEFHLKPTDTVGKYHYTLVYGEGDMRQERKYTLVEEDAENGKFYVDENNGIILDDKAVGNRLYSVFEVQGNLLTTFMTFHEDHLVFEITVARKEKKRVTHADNEQKTEVISYPITTVQRAILKKQ